MSASLRDFVVDVASAPDLAVRFSADPLGELDRLGLTEKEKAAVLSRDSGALRELLGAARKGAANVIAKKGKKKKKKKPARKSPAQK